MAESMKDIMNPGVSARTRAKFPHAPEDWSEEAAGTRAGEEGIELSDDHWVAVRALQEYFAKNDRPNVRELHDALEEKFHGKGGLKFLYGIFPGGPVAQGCRLAGLEAPAGASNPSFGSVQ